MAVWQRLVQANPRSAQFQGELAECHHRIGGLLASTGRPDEALAAYEQALTIRQELAVTRPDIIQFQFDLARSISSVGYLLQITGKPGEALAAFERSLAMHEKLVEANPNVTEFQFVLAYNHITIGWILTQTGKPVEALTSYGRAIAILRKLVEANPSEVRFQSQLATSLTQGGVAERKAGRLPDAVASIRQGVAIYERLPTLRLEDQYNVACGHALLAGLAAMPGSGMTADEGRIEADWAMRWLHRAVAAGYRNVSVMRKDPDLNPLRSRPDFQLLMMDLAFPAEPFAWGDDADRPGY
jgi:tetratricopeptide (TPR) repeat protein